MHCWWKGWKCLELFLAQLCLIKESQTDQQSWAQKLAEKESELLSLRNEIPQSVQLKAELETKTQEIEKIQAELAQVQEQLVGGGDVQTKLDQSGFEVMLKEKEAELEKVKAEFASFRESLQVALYCRVQLMRPISLYIAV